MESLTDRILGHYRLAHTLDEWGVAPVYRAQHIHYGQPAAVKILCARLSERPALRERFGRAAEALSHLRHPNIPRVTDFIVEEELVALAMALLEGESLDQELGRRGAPYPAAETAERILPLVSALDHAHAQETHHHTLTPSKIMLTHAQGALLPRLLGFGVASVVAGPLPQAPIAGRSNPRWYLAPEQCRGGSNPGPAADQYALGVITYQLLTARPPCDGDTGDQILEAHLHATPTSPTHLQRSLPEEVSSVVLRALAKNPEGRWPGVRAFGAALADAIGVDLQQAPPAPPATAVEPQVVAPAPGNAPPPTAVLPVAPMAASLSPASGPAPVAPSPALPPDHRPPRPQTLWGADAPPATPRRRPMVAGWMLVLALVVAGSAALIVWALLSEEKPPRERPPATGVAPPPPRPRSRAQPPRSPPAPPDAGAPRTPIPLKGAAIAPGIPSTGSPACDRYLTAYKCFMARLPGSSAGTSRDSLRQMANAFRSALASGLGKATMEKNCDRFYEVMGDRLSGLSLAKGCFVIRPKKRPRPLPPGSKSAPPLVGIDTCDAYLSLFRCYISKLPPTTRDALQKGYQKMVDGWRAATTTPTAKTAMRKTCGTLLETFRKTIANYAPAQGCLK